MNSKYIAFLYATTLLVASLNTEKSFANTELDAQIAPLLSSFKSIKKVEDNSVKVELGKKLYLDTKLSKNGNQSCNSCHDLNTYGVDNKKVSPGSDGKNGDRNSPSSFNAALHIAQFWDGRAADLEAQALGPVLNPIEMGLKSKEDVEKVLSSDKDYIAMFAKAFPEDKNAITFENMGRAIGAFEKTLITPSRFDSYIDGDKSALTEDEKKGLMTFVQSGCTVCHSGVGVGGGMYQKLGLVVPYTTSDEGRFKVTKLESDKYVFKVPSLRNITKTAPYFHDGSVDTLSKAITLMGKHQLGRDLSEADVKSIETFLGSLTGELPK